MWSVYELNLESDSNSTNPYTEVSVTATFKGPEDSEKTVQGFWNGDRHFLVRFTPTVQGQWTYVTRSSDPGLDHQIGIINCTSPQEGHGFLRRDANYPYSFVWDDGSRYLMIGQTYYDLLKLAMVSDDWHTSIDNSLATGMNKVRFFIAPNPKERPKSPTPATSPYGSDRDTLNLPHWQKLDEVVRYLNKRGMVAEVLLFNYPSYGNLYGTQSQDERYLRYVLARYGAFPNVIWCLVNEWDSIKSQSYWNDMGTIVRHEDPWISAAAFLRPLSIHPNTSSDFQFFDAEWPVHAIIQYGVRNDQYTQGDQWGYQGIKSNWGHNLPVVNDEYGYIGETSDRTLEGNPKLTRTKHRQIMWGIYLAGGYGAAGDKNQYSDGRPYFSSYWHKPQEYEDITHLVNFFTTKDIEYWKMSSQKLASEKRVYALANPGKQYVFYAADGGSFSAKIAPGTYTAHRYNPRNGEERLLDEVTGGAASFTLPDKDWVVYLNARPSA